MEVDTGRRNTITPQSILAHMYLYSKHRSSSGDEEVKKPNKRSSSRQIFIFCAVIPRVVIILLLLIQHLPEVSVGWKALFIREHALGHI